MTRSRAPLRRRVLLLLGSSLWLNSAWAGSYLDQASMLVHLANVELSYLRRKLYDRELAKTVHRLAMARLAAAQAMVVPKEVVQAHPHLLLMLADAERAANAAVERNAEEFLKFQRAARDEEELFRGILKQLGWQVPPFP